MNATDPNASGGGPLDLRVFVDLDEPERVALLRSLAEPEVELRRLGDAAETIAATDPQSSLVASEAVANAAEVFGLAALVARARRGGVAARAYLGRLEEAIDAALEARKAAEAARLPVEVARLRLAAMHPLLKLGRAAEAIAEGEAAAKALADAGDDALAARADINLGNVHKAAGRCEAALVHLDRAREILREDAALVATIDNTRGEALLELDRFDDARAAFENALGHFKHAGQAFATAIVEGNLADLAARAGDLPEAFARFASARERLGDRADGHAARLAMEEGEVFEAVGLHDVALPRLEEARRRFEALGLAYESIRAGLAEATALESLGRPDEAIASLDSLEPLLARLDHPALRFRRDATLARLVAERSRVDDAGRDRAEALGRRIFGEVSGGDAAAMASTASRLVRLHTRLEASRWHEALGRPDAAFAAAEEAVTEAEGLGLAVAISEAHTRTAELARTRRDLERAIASARRAVGAVERTRDSLGAERLRAAFTGRSLGAYEELVLALVARGDEASTGEAFEVAELARSRTLLERLGRRIGLDPRDEHAASGEVIRGEDAEIRRLLERLRGLHARLSSEARGDERSSGAGGVRSELAEVEAELERRLAARAAAAPRAHAVAPRSGLAGGGWRSGLAADEAIVEYFEAAGRWIAFAATADRIRAVPLGVSTPVVHELLDRFAFRARRRLRIDGPPPGARGVAVESILGELGERLWAPIAEEIAGRRRVTIVPHGVLHGVPFAALGGGLLERHEISTAPSVAVWLRLRESENRMPDRGRTLLVGVADEAAPEVESEILRIESALHGADPEVLRGGAATADAVLAALADPRVGTAHLACHGRFLPEAPHASGLRLSDRWISVRDLAALPRTPPVVVLSGCETGGLAVRRGEEVLGLARTLLAKGTRSVIASLWPVSDRSTCELMVDFHRCWSTVERGEGRTASGALAEAQRTLGRSEELAHPAHWASFIAIGHAS